MTEYLDKPIYTRVGNYVLVRVIGRGTQYTLFQALDPLSGGMVVIKILHVSSVAPSHGTLREPDRRENTASPEADHEPADVLEERLRREASALARLSHPNVPAVYGTGEQNGHLYLVMEYLHGHSLRQHLDCGALPLEEAVGNLEQVAAAVDAVHAQGVLHRDIRPSTIMIQHNGCVKLMDFGLARQAGDATVTLMGAWVGEPAYMAPEQLRGQPASMQSDFWALGVLLYEMLAGCPPFQGANSTLAAHQVMMGEPPPIPGLPAAVQAVVDKALSKDPQARYQRAGEMVEALRVAVGAPSRPAFLADPGRSHPRRTPPRRLLLAAGAGVVGLAAAIALHLSGHMPSVPPPVPTASAATNFRHADVSPGSRPAPGAHVLPAPGVSGAGTAAPGKTQPVAASPAGRPFNGVPHGMLTPTSLTPGAERGSAAKRPPPH